MKFKKVISSLLVVSMVGMLGACGSSNDKTNTASTKNDSNSTTNSNSTTDNSNTATSSDHAEEISFDFFDVAANYQGEQVGWFAKILKDKFNIKLNIIAPQVGGDALYQTRASSGNLGDLVILEPADFNDCVENKLIKDITGEIGNYKNLMEYKEQIDVYNNGIPNNDSKATYGIPCQMTNTSPTSYSQDVIYSSPMLRWDLYSELGRPDIADLDGLIDVLAQMQEKHPTNADGDPAYGLTLWADWDGGDNMMGIANVVQLTTWYGEKIMDSLILKPDNSFIPVTDKSGSYYKILKFLNSAYKKGIVDPDSGTQDWNTVCSKISAGQTYLLWYSWETGFWNSTDRLNEGTGFIFTPVADQNYYCDSDTYYGSGRVFGVGAGVDGEKYTRAMELLDWLASPEGSMVQHVGIEGFNYEKGEDGRYYEMNSNALMDNLPVPEEFGGGNYQDGNNAINQWIVDASSMNPLTGEQYAKQYWSTYKEAMMNQMKKDWQAKFGAEEPVDWMRNNGKLLVSPNVSVARPNDTSEISVIRSQCGDTLCDASWRMIFAKDDAEFDSMWDAMATEMDGYGFQELLEFDKQKWQPTVDAKVAASK